MADERYEAVESERLVVISQGEDASHDLARSTDRLLYKISGLRTLVLSGDLKRMPDWQAIARHSKSLTELHIGSSKSCHTIVSSNWVELVCKHCENLQQLSVPLPRKTLGRIVFTMVFPPKAALDPGACDDCASSRYKVSDGIGCRELRRYLRSILKLKKLVTLRLLDSDMQDIPENWIAGHKQQLLDRYELLRKFVLREFREAGHSQLSVLSLRQGEDAPHFLVGGTKLTSWEEKEASVRMVSLAEARAEEPRSEILEIGHCNPGSLQFPRLE